MDSIDTGERFLSYYQSWSLVSAVSFIDLGFLGLDGLFIEGTIWTEGKGFSSDFALLDWKRREIQNFWTLKFVKFKAWKNQNYFCSISLSSIKFKLSAISDFKNSLTYSSVIYQFDND